MSRRLTVSLSLAFACSALMPSPAAAQWFATGFTAPLFGGQVGNPPALSYGGSFGWWGESRYGFEVEASHTPDFFQAVDVPDAVFSESRVATLMFNGRYHFHEASAQAMVRPYVTGGAGWMRSHIGNDDDFIRARSHHMGINVGGGVHAMFSDRWGVGGDLRYFRDLQHLEGVSEFFSLGEQKVDFWRASASIVLHF